MTKEEKKQLEDTAIALEAAADTAHNAAAEKPGDDALQEAAQTAEDKATEARTAADAAVVDDEPAPVVDEEEEKGDDEDIDFGKELQELEGKTPPAPAPAAKTPLEKAQTALFHKAEEVKRLGGDPATVLGTPPAPAPAPAKEEEKGFVTQDDLNKRDLLAELRRVSKTDAEYRVLQWHAANSIKLTGDPIKDAENAYFIAHKGKIKRSFDEIRRAADTRTTPATPPGRRAPADGAKAPMLSREEATVMTRRGFKLQPDGSWKGKRYTMTYDKVKKGWIEVPHAKK